jgi:hypothetical protein
MKEMSSLSLAEKAADPELVWAAVRRGAREAVLMHARAGRSVPTTRDGKVVWIPPDELLALTPLGADAAATAPSAGE